MAESGSYVTGAYLPSDAARKFRLVGFDPSFNPNGWKLKKEHEAKLDELLMFVRYTSSFFYWVIGFASKRGDAGLNKRLSYNRAFSVERYLSVRNQLFADDDRLERFDGVGEEGYKAAESDNSWDMRAVEVHLFLGNVKPPRPPNVKPVPHLQTPLPGGPRFREWQVAAVFGIQIPVAGLGPVGIQATVNLFAFKKTDRGDERHWYVGGGPGLGLSLPALGALKNAQTLWNIITAGSFSGLSFSDPVKAINPFTFDELNGADVALAQIGGGVKPPGPLTPVGPWVPTGWQFARMNVSGIIWKRDPQSGQPKLTSKGETMLKNVDVGGPQQALGVGAGGQVNTLLKVS